MGCSSLDHASQLESAPGAPRVPVLDAWNRKCRRTVHTFTILPRVKKTAQRVLGQGRGGRKSSQQSAFSHPLRVSCFVLLSSFGFRHSSPPRIRTPFPALRSRASLRVVGASPIGIPDHRTDRRHRLTSSTPTAHVRTGCTAALGHSCLGLPWSLGLGHFRSGGQRLPWLPRCRMG